MLSAVKILGEPATMKARVLLIHAEGVEVVDRTRDSDSQNDDYALTIRSPATLLQVYAVLLNAFLIVLVHGKNQSSYITLILEVTIDVAADEEDSNVQSTRVKLKKSIL